MSRESGQVSPRGALACSRRARHAGPWLRSAPCASDSSCPRAGGWTSSASTPREQWAVMRDVARHADAGPWESVWVYDHFHTVPQPTDEACHEAWTLMAALGAVDRPGPARPDVHLHELPQPGLPGEGRRHLRHRVRRARRDGHRRRLVRARVARLRLRLPVRRACGSGMLDEGVQIMRQAWTEGRATLNGKHYQVDGAIVRPLPLQEGGIPLWIAGGGEKVTLKIAAKYAQYTNFDGTLRGLHPQVRAARRALPRRRHRLRRDRPLGQLQRRDRRHRGRGRRPVAAAQGPDDAAGRRRDAPRASWAGTAGCRPAARPSRSWRTCASSRPRG